MKTIPIDYSVKNKVDNIRKKQGHILSSHAFTSLYLWQNQMGLSLYLQENLFSVQASFKGENAWFFPCGEELAKISFVDEFIKKNKGKLIYLRQEDKEWLEQKFPGRFLLTEDPDSDEYLYDIEQQLSLIGKKYANERTQVHKVERELNIHSEKLGESNLSDAMEILDKWSLGEHRFAGCDLRDDEVDRLALQEREKLNIQGIILYLEEQPVAIVAGFPLTADTFDVVVAKAIVSLQGVSYYSKREMMKVVSPFYRLINLEEDLGLTGLRTMKQLMSPISKNLIWEATLL